MSDSINRLLPQCRQFFRWCLKNPLTGCLQFGDIHQHAALEQCRHLLPAANDLATRQEQRVVHVAHVEGQWHANAQAVPDGFEIDEMPSC